MDRVYGDYSILADPGNPAEPWVLGEGTFGVTYRAKHRVLREEVALKVLRADFLDERGFRRFANEARALRDLNHAHIAAFDYVGSAGGQLYCAMEFCDGGDLQELASKKEGLSVLQILEIGMQVSSALNEAHGKHYVHRDIKPSNLMLKLAGKSNPLIKVIDFGLAGNQQREEDPSLGSEGHTTEGFKGTRLFASPEQIDGRRGDARSDLYSLGIALWFLALGRKPEELDFETQAELNQAHLSQIEFEMRDLPEVLWEVIRPLVRKRPEDRPQSAKEVKDSFRRLRQRLVMENPELLGEGIRALVAEPKTTIKLEKDTRSFPKVYSEIREMLWEASIGLVYQAVREPDKSEVGIVIVGKYQSRDKATKEIGRERFEFLTQAVEEHLSLVNSGEYPEALIPPRELRWFAEGEVIIECEPVVGLTLHECLRRQGKVGFETLLPFAARLAEAMDYLEQRKMPGLAIYENQILAQSRSGRPVSSLFRREENSADWQDCVPRLLPLRFPDEDERGEGQETMTPSMMGTIIGGSEKNADKGPVEALAAKIYRWVGGRPIAQAAWITPDGYSSIPGLGAEANQLLRVVISGQTGKSHLSCLGLLEELCEAEGIHFKDSLNPLSVEEEPASSTPPPLPLVSSKDLDKREARRPPAKNSARPSRGNRRQRQKRKSSGPVVAWTMVALLLACLVLGALWVFSDAGFRKRFIAKGQDSPPPQEGILQREAWIDQEGTEDQARDEEKKDGEVTVSSYHGRAEGKSTNAPAADRDVKEVVAQADSAEPGIDPDKVEEEVASGLAVMEDENSDVSTKMELGKGSGVDPSALSPDQRYESFGIRWETGRSGQAGGGWIFHFKDGEWKSADAMADISSAATRFAQCEMWTITDREIGKLNPAWAYHPTGSKGVAIRKGNPETVSYQPPSVNVSGNPYIIGIDFRVGTPLHQRNEGKTFFGKVNGNTVISDSETRQIAGLKLGANRHFREGDHLIVQLPNGWKLTFVNYYKYNQN